MLLRSLQILANSEDGILTMAWYSASGIPRCSLSISISFISKSEILSCAVRQHQIQITSKITKESDTFMKLHQYKHVNNYNYFFQIFQLCHIPLHILYFALTSLTCFSIAGSRDLFKLHTTLLTNFNQ